MTKIERLRHGGEKEVSGQHDRKQEPPCRLQATTRPNVQPAIQAHSEAMRNVQHFSLPLRQGNEAATLIDPE